MDKVVCFATLTLHRFIWKKLSYWSYCVCQYMCANCI